MSSSSSYHRLPWLLLFCVGLLWQPCTSTSPIEVHGYKFFDSETGDEFLVRGIAYEPRPNSGRLNRNSVDYFTEEHRHIWERDIPFLQSLGVNAVRIYAVDPDQNHDAFMCAMNAAGIYVLVSLARDCPTCAVTRDQAPDCYPAALKRQGQSVINAFAKYSNVLGFSAGNEVNHFTPSNNPEWNGPCQRKFLRDMRYYIASCPNMRKVPVGLISADSERDQVSLYYNCKSDVGDEYEHAEWFGLNVYLSCAGNITDYEDEQGFKDLAGSFESYDYSIPVMLTEFGCLSNTFPTVDGYEGQRTFEQARWLMENPQLRDQFAGGFSFEYSMELQNAIAEVPYPFKQLGGQNYGVGYFSPENCDDSGIPCEYNPLPTFASLGDTYRESLERSKGVHLDDFKVPKHRQGRTECPSNFTALSAFHWRADRLRDHRCPAKGSESQFVCPANLDDLHGIAVHQQSRWIELLKSITSATLFLVVVSVIYSMVMSNVEKMRTYSERYMKDDPTWITVVVPYSVSSTPTERSISGSDSSGEMLSMKAWSYQSAVYHSIESIDSDLSDESSDAAEQSIPRI